MGYDPDVPKARSPNDLQLPNSSIWYECDAGETCKLIKYYEVATDGEKEWKQIHRNDGPALLSNMDQNIKKHVWYVHDKIHREDGPAVVYQMKTKKEVVTYLFEWFLHDSNISSEVLTWINKNNLPLPQDWTSTEKILFKLRFVE